MAPFPSQIHDIAQKCAQAGGRAILVGGCVRDTLLHHPVKDFDLEVFGLDFLHLKKILDSFGTVIETGKAFGVLKLHNLDISIPRTDNKTGKGHRGFHIQSDPHMPFTDAARRRDLTINSMGFDPLTQELLDPFGGQEHLFQGILHATDPVFFGEDPLRGLRVAQFAARFCFTPDPELIRLCQDLDLSELAAERLYVEFHKLLLKGKKPSLGLAFLRDSTLIRFFPELEALIGTPQTPHWHPEGDVWVHTLMTVDVAAHLRTGVLEADEPLMFGALCHDMGKPATTTIESDGRIRSLKHEKAGVQPTKTFLNHLRARKDLVTQVASLVEHHLCPLMYPETGAHDGAYRRLARTLATSDISMELLARVARADHLGRTTAEALEGQCPNVEIFLQKAQNLGVLHAPHPPAVQGRHLLARGMTPSPQFQEILERCLAHQDTTGLTDPTTILNEVLGKGDVHP